MFKVYSKVILILLNICYIIKSVKFVFIENFIGWVLIVYDFVIFLVVIIVIAYVWVAKFIVGGCGWV